MIDRRAGANCRHNPERHGHDDRKEHRRHRQLDRRRHPLGDRRCDTLPGAQRPAEVADDRPSQERAVLDVERPVQTELLPEVGDILAGRALAEHRFDRVAGYQMDERENQRCDA